MATRRKTTNGDGGRKPRAMTASQSPLQVPLHSGLSSEEYYDLPASRALDVEKQ